MDNNQLYKLSPHLKLLTWTIVIIWMIIAAFPLFWMATMSFKLPLDAFDANALTVIFGPNTKSMIGGISVVGVLVALGFGYLFLKAHLQRERIINYFINFFGSIPKFLVVLVLYLVLMIAALIVFFMVVPWISSLFNMIFSGIPILNLLVEPFMGMTTQHYEAVWIENEFYKQFINTVVVTTGVVSISLTVATLAAYGIARTRSTLAFWLLIMALCFRALPYSTLVTGYLAPFIEYGIYGKRFGVIIVLVAINQPFTIWMLRSFFMNIPPELDEAAQVDGCNRLQAFWKVIMPVMWPGVITTGLFSFLLAYNDYMVAMLLLDGDARTMVPAITQYFNRETTLTDQVEAIAAAASITAPIFVMVMFFQKQLVSGLTQGAVKG
jgi:trehalose/maltose transport system permease protein